MVTGLSFDTFRKCVVRALLNFEGGSTQSELSGSKKFFDGGSSGPKRLFNR